jgi:hypothetical protein
LNIAHGVLEVSVPEVKIVDANGFLKFSVVDPPLPIMTTSGEEGMATSVQLPVGEKYDIGYFRRGILPEHPRDN